MMLVLAGPVHAADAAYRLGFAPPGPAQRAVVGHVLGADFLRGAGVFPAETLVAEVDLNGDGKKDIVAVQQGFCSNHACTFHFLLNVSPGVWEDAAAVDSWAIPYVIDGPQGAMRELVIFDHIADDCLACSEPKPVRLAWRPGPSGTVGAYVQTGPVPDDDASAFKPSWRWRGQE